MECDRSVPKRGRPPDARATPRPRASKRAYDELERRRAALQAELAALGDGARAHPAYSNARKLLNEKFRAGALAQRAAILDSAAWLIQLLDTLAKLD